MTDENFPEEPVQTFDVGAWIHQGERALEDLGKREAHLRLELASVQTERRAILDALGRDDGRAELSQVPGQKVMIRPLLKEVLIEAEGHGLSLDEIVDLVQTKQPRARRKSIETSLHRLTKQHERIEEFEVAGGATHWKMVLDHETTIAPPEQSSEQPALAV